MKTPIITRIKQSVAKTSGDIVLVRDLKRFGSPSAVARALRHLSAEGVLYRLGYGVYAKTAANACSDALLPRQPLEVLAAQVVERMCGGAKDAGKNAVPPVRKADNRRMSRKIAIGVWEMRCDKVTLGKVADRRRLQRRIPGNLSEKRYISGMAALNLRAPENTSGDWHFGNVFYNREPQNNAVTVAGEGEELNTNHIFRNYGIYDCTDILRGQGLHAEGAPSFAANHFRAILDLAFECLRDQRPPVYLAGATSDYLDTEEEREFVLDKAAMMSPHLSEGAQAMLSQWIEKERTYDSGR
ncbi:MAG: type IV toxin-antitoxin system AbiEi family antitoxin domain-containing protein [Betaproteobacteria bacterium]|nr:type IV toxin-antitoxin system AbiEi family antitoxin domain-containing protein [Betaproteobacteria bacterium]